MQTAEMCGQRNFRKSRLREIEDKVERRLDVRDYRGRVQKRGGVKIHALI